MIDSEAVLVVADDHETLTRVRAGLSRNGYRVDVAGTGAEARARIRAGGVGLVLLDLRPSGPEPRALLDEARAQVSPPEFIIVTAEATLDSAIAAVEQGMAGYVTKPVDLPRLEGIAARVFERRRLQRENARLQREAADRLAETETLLRIAGEVNATLDLGEALRRVCRELARLTGADTTSAYLLESGELRPVVAYHVPKEYLTTLAAATLPLEGQGFQAAIWQDRRPVHSDDVANDPRFTSSSAPSSTSRGCSCRSCSSARWWAASTRCGGGSGSGSRPASSRCSRESPSRSVSSCAMPGSSARPSVTASVWRP